MRNIVTIQLKKDEIWIKISESAEEDEIIENLIDKMTDLKRLYKDENMPIRVVGKVLKNREIEVIQGIIKSKLNVNVEFESPKTLGLSEIKKAYSHEIDSSETKFYKGSLRSGKKIEYEGSIVILGDVNSGAEVIASENIVVLGVLRGLAHAGAKGNQKAIIASNNIDCPQIRISNKILEMRKNQEGNVKTYAYINEDINEIVIE